MTAYLSKLDMMAQDRLDKMLNVILSQICETAAKEYMQVHGALVMSMITPELVNKILVDKIRDSIQLKGDK